MVVTSIDVIDQVAHSGAVTILVIIPGDKFDKVIVERDASLGIKDTTQGGARQLVVQLALLIMFIVLGSYVSSFTPITSIVASAEGAEIITFFAPPSKCA